MRPELLLFCILKGVRALSALNAAINLAQLGYVHEVATIIRVLIESTTQIDFVLSERATDGTLSPKAAKFIAEYFSDYQRNAATAQKIKLTSREVHDVVGAALDSSGIHGRAPAAEILTDVYRTFSNYVHGRYPEIMDMYGGDPPRFHTAGMLGTPKDEEGLAYIEVFSVTTSQVLARIVQSFDLRNLIEADSQLSQWYLSEVT
jgi:hypothetical protein